MKTQLDRRDCINVMMACKAIQRTFEEAGDPASAKKWKRFHEKLGGQLLKHGNKMKYRICYQFEGDALEEYYTGSVSDLYDHLDYIILAGGYNITWKEVK